MPISFLNTNNGGSFSAFVAPTPVFYTVGQSALGGKIAYILQPGDPGYDANVQHGLVAATSDQSTSIFWWNGSYVTTGATATAIGTGLANTNTIIAVQGAVTTNYAAGLARAHNGGGYTDWYLPNKVELNKLWLNSQLIGGFTTAGYWSSEEIDASNTNKFFAWGQYFGNGGYYISSKNIAAYVRAIRAF